MMIQIKTRIGKSIQSSWTGSCANSSILSRKIITKRQFWSEKRPENTQELLNILLSPERTGQQNNDSSKVIRVFVPRLLANLAFDESVIY